MTGASDSQLHSPPTNKQPSKNVTL